MEGGASIINQEKDQADDNEDGAGQVCFVL